MRLPEELGLDKDWVSASSTHNYSEQNTLVDWLNFHGKEFGFVPDGQRPDHDQRFSYVSALLRQSWTFERLVVDWLATLYEVRRIGHGPSDARVFVRWQETKAAMKEGVPIIAQGVLWNPDDRTEGMVDLLIRSDILFILCPAAFEGESEGAELMPAPGICTRNQPYHYRVIDIKFTTLDLVQGGEASRKHLPYMVQNRIYNEALAKTQGYTPPASYLMGRDLFKALARVNHDNPELNRLAREGIAWIRRVREQGAAWQPLPSPTVPELRPNVKAWADLDWHRAKQEIAEALHDLTLLPYVNAERRARALDSGITRWDDPALSAEVLGFGDTPEGRRIDAVLAANRPATESAIVPETIRTNVGEWRSPGPLECFVIFQTVTDQMDDFSRLPERGGTEMVFMVNWGWLDRAGQWQARQLVAHDLSSEAELMLSEAWKAELERLAKSAGGPVADVRLTHWGSTRLLLREMSWHDILLELILEEPIGVRGALGFGLQEVAAALHRSGLIQSEVPALPPGPLAATAGAWWSAKEAGRGGIPMSEVDVIKTIGAYSDASCRSMMEILALLRHRASASLAEAA
jgi:hypothetical protein